MISKRIKIDGIVQGVGFRPFVYQLAIKYDIVGWVNNGEDGVHIELSSSKENFDSFINEIKSNPPVLSKILNIEVSDIESKIFSDFKIMKSENSGSKSTLISPDIAICSECEKELYDKTNHRYNYPLINCTNCGPRYSIIKTVPYDRVNTSMKDFIMCEFCKSEYENPNSRRYHAQPISCEVCGPKIKLFNNKKQILSQSNKAIEEISKEIKKGSIVAIKGLGGFHLICDATNYNSVELLRNRKNRPTKPYAVMVKDLDQARLLANISKKEEELLLSKEKPIVLLKSLSSRTLSQNIAPEIDRIGVFLAYTPLQKILFEYLDIPIVATSANLSEEPIISDIDDLIFKLSNVVDLILDVEREIVNACDDSVVQVVNEEIISLRVARGYAPEVIKLPKKIDKKILSVGANQKNTIALAFDDNLIISPHIGDLNSLKAFEYFERTVETFKRFYEFEPDLIVCDKHPNYETTKWAKNQNKEYIEIQHHYAHTLATMAENNLSKKVLSFAFDGTGYGDDGNIWGGEVFIADNKEYTRVNHFKYFRLLGGEKAIKEPRRVGLSFLFERYCLDDVLKLDNFCVKSFTQSEIRAYYTLWQKGLNSPQTSSVGRIFDAVASLAGICQFVTYEGESGLILESLYDTNINEYYTYEIVDGIICINKMIEEIILDNMDSIKISSKFINTLSKIILEIALTHSEYDVVLTGGVFQNKTLLELTLDNLNNHNIKTHYQKTTAINDGSISLGQIWSQI